MYSEFTCIVSEIFGEINNVSAFEFDNFETRVVQQFSEFFTGI